MHVDVNYKKQNVRRLIQLSHIKMLRNNLCKCKLYKKR